MGKSDRRVSVNLLPIQASITKFFRHSLCSQKSSTPLLCLVSGYAVQVRDQQHNGLSFLNSFVGLFAGHMAKTQDQQMLQKICKTRKIDLSISLMIIEIQYL